MKILVSGASFAGLSTAYWMCGLGHRVTVVEAASKLRNGGTAVNIRGDTIDVVGRMGILDRIRANRLDLRRWEFKTADDRTVRTLVLRAEGDPPADDDLEIERDVLLAILFDAVKERCEIVFGNRIAGLHEKADGIEVAFQKGRRERFDLCIGCDGLHSSVRALWFGEEARYLHFMQRYFSITIVDKLLIERDTAQMFNVPGKAIMLNAYKEKTDIVLAFAAQTELPVDHRDESQQRRIVAEAFAGLGWRSAELLREVEASSTFYFDKLCQIRMPAWSRGRVALVGDAAYCASPAAGMGGSLAIDGASAFGAAMKDSAGDYAKAFERYDTQLRPFIDEVQAGAVRFGLEMLVPMSEAAIRERNAKTGPAF